MKVSIGSWTKEEFREYAERMSKYFDLKGCRTPTCVNKRIKRINSKKMNVLVEHRFANHLIRESWLNPHPVYKEILGFTDEEYDASRAREFSLSGHPQISSKDIFSLQRQPRCPGVCG